MTEFQRLKGFRDFLPEEMEARREVFDRIEETVRSFGFREIDTPSLETLDLFLVKSGEELVEQTYSFEDKGERDVTMVPEQTPSRARILADRKELSMPAKWYSTSKRWRYESTQRGRLREFYQTDIDIFGTDSVQADSEILAVTVEIMDSLRVLDAVEVLVNDRRLLEGILESYGISGKEEVMEVIDDKEKMGAGEFLEELGELGLTEEEAENVDELTSIAGPIAEELEKVEDLAPEGEDAEEAVKRLRELTESLESYGVEENVKLDLSIVRGLAYYTGLVFEVFDTEGELRAVCGGGRYDDLVGLFGGEEIPAVGFAIGDAVMEELMRREGVWPEEELVTGVYVLPVSGEVRAEALEIVEELRSAGNIVETGLKDRNVSSQFDYADSINAEKVVVVGERDLENDEVTVKDMESGEERKVDRSEILSVL
ncbi:MAG: histidine--tRNA ligase [Candidatus Nanohaloarchaeota archaeon QJJ-7]|nr:histidine--tRNA ligase [Candidatus Nanohaloarchaeota archaeon QJJ-7]